MPPATTRRPAEPFFLPGPRGKLLAMYHRPQPNRRHGEAILYVPPFAEEMNRSRRVAALQARELAKLGYGVLLLDLYGCGDSAGEFHRARWDIWKNDLARATDWLKDRGSRRISLWGLRLGGLLAAEFAGGSSERFERIVLWQPVLSGAAMLTQFLRIGGLRHDGSRVGGSRIGGSRIGGTRELRQTLAAGTSVEVAGYQLAAELAAELDRRRLAPLATGLSAELHWFAFVPARRRPIDSTAMRLIDQWSSEATAVSVHRIIGKPFWALQQTVDCRAVLGAMKRVFQRERK